MSIDKSIISKLVFILSLLTSVFWCLGQLVNVYHFAVTGVIFEILWLPMIASLFILPLLGLILWGREKFSLKSLYFYSFLIILPTILLIILKN